VQAVGSVAEYRKGNISSITKSIEQNKQYRETKQKTKVRETGSRSKRRKGQQSNESTI
jgi:hypothetical protein